MKDQLDLLIRSGNAIIAIETRDEERVMEIVRDLAESTHRTLFEWSMTAGLKRVLPKAASVGVEPGKPARALEYVLENEGDKKELYVFKDLSPHARDANVVRLLRDIYPRENACLILVESETLPEGVRRLCVPLALPLPTTA